MGQMNRSINLFFKQCGSCEGFSTKDNPAYISYQAKLNRGEVILYPCPDMYIYCQVCNGTGKHLTSIGQITKASIISVGELIAIVGKEIKSKGDSLD